MSSSTATVHLWEIGHPYYCSGCNWYSNDAGEQFDSWADFRDTMGRSDPDLNLLFRWDWERADPADYDPGYELPADRLELFFMLQRKGKFVPIVVSNMTEGDGPEVRAWLATRWTTMLALWQGVES